MMKNSRVVHQDHLRRLRRIQLKNRFLLLKEKSDSQAETILPPTELLNSSRKCSNYGKSARSAKGKLPYCPDLLREYPKAARQTPPRLQILAEFLLQPKGKQTKTEIPFCPRFPNPKFPQLRLKRAQAWDKERNLL